MSLPSSPALVAAPRAELPGTATRPRLWPRYPPPATGPRRGGVGCSSLPVLNAIPASALTGQETARSKTALFCTILVQFGCDSRGARERPTGGAPPGPTPTSPALLLPFLSFKRGPTTPVLGNSVWVSPLSLGRVRLSRLP